MDVMLPVSVMREEEERRRNQRGHGSTGQGSEEWDWMEGGERREKNDAEGSGETEEEDGDEDEEESRCPECERNPSLFCQEEWRSVCEDCAATGRHRGHAVHPVTKTVNDCKAKLRACLKTLFGTVKGTAKVFQTCSQALRFIPLQARQTETQIKEEFEKLHRFLREEEEARLVALREEEEKRMRWLQERRERLRKEMCSVWFAIQASERDSRRDDIAFLQNYKKTVKRSWQGHKMPEAVGGPLINRAKHVGNLCYAVWDKMRHIAPYTPVTLDPNTANSFLSLSSDLTSVKESEEDDDDGELPDTPERFSCCGEMLASQGFSSGTHSWVVDVHDNDSWILGVATESIARKELVAACPEEGLWALSMRRGRFQALESPAVSLALPSSSSRARGDQRHTPATVRRLRVCLDYDGERVSFADADRDEHLYAFAFASSSCRRRAGERVYPYFSTSCLLNPVTVVPQRVRVEVWEPGAEEEEEESGPKVAEEMGKMEKAREAVRRKEAERRRRRRKEREMGTES